MIDEMYDEIVQLRVKELMDEYDMSVSDIAECTGLGVASIRDCVNGKHVTLKKLAAIAEVLCVEMREMFEITGWYGEERGDDAYYKRAVQYDYDDAGVYIGRIDGNASYLSHEEIARVADVINGTMDEAIDVIEGLRVVTPKEYSMIAYRLKEKAYLVMKHVQVSEDACL